MPNARIVQDQDDYNQRYESLVERYNAAEKSLDEVTSQIAERESRSAELSVFMKELKKRKGTIKRFDRALWASMVDYVTISREKELTFTFRDGTEITV